MSGSGISWAICKSASRSRQINTPAPHHSSCLQAGCPSCCPTNSVKALKAKIRNRITCYQLVTKITKIQLTGITFAVENCNLWPVSLNLGRKYFSSFFHLPSKFTHTFLQYVAWQWHNFDSHLCQLVFAAILWQNSQNACHCDIA